LTRFLLHLSQAVARRCLWGGLCPAAGSGPAVGDSFAGTEESITPQCGWIGVSRTSNILQLLQLCMAFLCSSLPELKVYSCTNSHCKGQLEIIEGLALKLSDFTVCSPRALIVLCRCGGRVVVAISPRSTIAETIAEKSRPQLDVELVFTPLGRWMPRC
jgi:hypothetical protein